MRVRFFPYDIEYSKDNTRIFGRTNTGEKIKLIDNSIEPFFWLLPKKDPKYLSEKISKLKYIKKTNIEKRTYLGEDYDAVKVFVNNNTDLSKAVEEIKQIPEIEGKKEIDIKFTKRYLLEKEITPLCCYEGEIDNGELKSIKSWAKDIAY